jgi:hypothetical protein
MNISVYLRMYEICIYPMLLIYFSLWQFLYPIVYLTLYGLTECIINQSINQSTSFMYHWHHLILTNDTIIKSATGKEGYQNAHLQFTTHIRLSVETDSFYDMALSVLYLQHAERHRFQHELQFFFQKQRWSKKKFSKFWTNILLSHSLMNTWFFSITFATVHVCLQDWNVVGSLLGWTGLETYHTLQMMNCCKRILTFLI